MADSESQHPLRPHLEATEVQLQEALEDVCEDETEVVQRDTDELIRIEEALAMASDAAKRAISLRKRIGVDEGEDEQPPAPPPA